jgi:hypothetical protein
MKPLIVLGSAPCTNDDYQNVLALGIDDHDILVVGIDSLKNTKGIVKYFASYHLEDLPKAQDKAYKIICHKQHNDLVDIIRPINLQKEPSGSSALLGTLVALDEGYTKIILCGCPLTGKNVKGQDYTQFRKGWLFHQEKVKPFVRAMSGWTKELLSEPTQEWLNGLE